MSKHNDALNDQAQTHGPGKLSGDCRAEKLREAARLIMEVACDLDATTTDCAHCGAGRFNHYGERKLSDQLLPLPAKLEKFARELETGSNKEKVER